MSKEVITVSDGRLSEWGERLGVLVQPAPVVIRWRDPRVDDKERLLHISRSPKDEACWLTTEFVMPWAFREDYMGVVALKRNGHPSGSGFALPKKQDSNKPFIFQVSDRIYKKEVELIGDLNGREMLGINSSEVRIFEFMHPHIGQRIPQEGYIAVHVKKNNPLPVMRHFVSEGMLVSGSVRGTFKRRVDTMSAQELPFEYLMGLDYPGMHQLGKMVRESLGNDFVIAWRNIMSFFVHR